MAKDRSGKQIRHLKGEIKRLQSEVKRLKKQPTDKDEYLDEIPSAITPCLFCPGIMYQTEMIGKSYFRCIECGRTKKV